MSYDSPAHQELAKLLALRRRELGQLQIAADRKAREVDELELAVQAFVRSAKAAVKRPDGAERVLTRDLRGPLSEILADGPRSVAQIAAALERRGIVMGFARNKFGAMAKAGDTIFREAPGVYGLLEDGR